MHRLAFALAPLLLGVQPAVGDTCSPARVMVILDKSSSMQTGTINGATKWSVAVDGLADVLAAYDSKAEFGLMTYPQPNACAPGAVDVAPAMGNRTAILGALVTPPPDAGNWTPMAQTLDVAATERSLQTAGPRHVILITDGWQWCSPYDPATRYDGTQAVERLVAAGVTPWIVGFGAEVDAAALNLMAVAAGTERANCNASSEDPAAANNCYFQVNNAAELVGALSTIAGNIATGEMCDGIDNDCDGQVDEDVTRDCSNACGDGVETCVAGAFDACSAPTQCPGNPETPDDDPADGGYRAGCTCETGAPLDASGLAPFGVLALVLLRRRRRSGILGRRRFAVLRETRGVVMGCGGGQWHNERNVDVEGRHRSGLARSRA